MLLEQCWRTHPLQRWQESDRNLDMPRSLPIKVRNSQDATISSALATCFCTCLWDLCHGRVSQAEARMRSTPQLKRRRLRHLSRSFAVDSHLNSKSSWNTPDLSSLNRSP